MCQENPDLACSAVVARPVSSISWWMFSLRAGSALWLSAQVSIAHLWGRAMNVSAYSFTHCFNGCPELQPLSPGKQSIAWVQQLPSKPEASPPCLLYHLHSALKFHAEPPEEVQAYFGNIRRAIKSHFILCSFRFMTLKEAHKIFYWLSCWMGNDSWIELRAFLRFFPMQAISSEPLWSSVTRPPKRLTALPGYCQAKENSVFFSLFSAIEAFCLLGTDWFVLKKGDAD